VAGLGGGAYYDRVNALLIGDSLDLAVGIAVGGDESDRDAQVFGHLVGPHPQRRRHLAVGLLLGDHRARARADAARVGYRRHVDGDDPGALPAGQAGRVGRGPQGRYRIVNAYEDGRGTVGADLELVSFRRFVGHLPIFTP
jgi:hypothetical protein